jgi:energy-coupling factor transporter ATP-binding protein EcfA2
LHLNGILHGSRPIRIMDLPVTAERLHQVRRQVGMVFQDPDHQLFMPTVFDDVSFGPVNMGMEKDDVADSVHRALAEVDVLPLARRSSHHLSVGEKRRVSIATVLSMNPAIVVLDEPSSNLDPKHRRELIELLNRLSMTKIIATHDLPLVWDTCNRVALMDAGQICAVGDTRAILLDAELMAKHDLHLPVIRS